MCDKDVDFPLDNNDYRKEFEIVETHVLPKGLTAYIIKNLTRSRYRKIFKSKQHIFGYKKWVTVPIGCYTVATRVSTDPPPTRVHFLPATKYLSYAQARVKTMRKVLENSNIEIHKL